MPLAYLPSPPSPYLDLGPLMIHWYAITAILGILAGALIGRRRWAARGGDPEAITDVLMLAVPLGILGGRLYHVATSWQLYFAAGAHPIQALYIWDGGLGIWGAIAGGTLGAWIAARRRGMNFAALADALAPGTLVGMAIGRLGCWFNQELYGRPSTLPWALHIDPAHRPAATPYLATYQPTFAYEALWDLAAAAFVIWAERRFRLDRGRVFALYVAAYTAGRGWIETLRIDPANHILGLRLNIWTSLILFIAAASFLYLRRAGRAGTAPAATAPATAGAEMAGRGWLTRAAAPITAPPASGTAVTPATRAATGSPPARLPGAAPPPSGGASP
jgi:prolipoprotein diacylglyceryl transferase